MNESRPGLPAQNEHFGPIGGSDYCALVSSANGCCSLMPYFSAASLIIRSRYCEAEPGPISLQGDHGPVEFRSLVVTPLTR